jgi:hypothetical protein
MLTDLTFLLLAVKFLLYRLKSCILYLKGIIANFPPNATHKGKAKTLNETTLNV